MKLKLVPRPAHVLKHAWSVRLIALAGILSGFEMGLPILDQWVSIPRGIFAALSAFTTCGAVIARLVVQEQLRESDDGE